MEVSRVENLPPPPGIINSIRAGFDATAARMTAVLFPLLLDLFIWLGPRLKVSALFDSVKGDMVALWKSGGISAEDIQRALDVYNSTIPHINLFWLLRTIPIGVSSLPFPQEAATPFGAPVILQTSALGLFGWIMLLNFAGWVGGGLYFRAVSRLILRENEQPIGIFRAITQTVFLSILWGILLMTAGVPLALALGVLMQVGQTFANFLVFAFSLASMWAIVPLYFWSHGIFVKKQNAITSMWGSWQMSRFMLPSNSMFVLTVFLISFGLNFLWSVPPQDSWITLVGIFGHSFVTTALLAASFIYYRDMTGWLEVALEKFKASKVNG